MSVRVSEFSNLRQFLYHHTNTRVEESEILERFATGKRVNRPSDDPLAYRRIKDVNAERAQNETFQESIETVLNEYAAVEGVLNSVGNGLTRVYELAVQGASETYGDLSREAIAEELDEIRETLVSLLNTSFEGRFLFSGTARTTQPFDTTGTYFGNSDTVDIPVSRTDSVVANFPGDALVFGAGGAGSADDMLDMIADLSAAMRADNTAAIDAEMQRIDPILERVNDTLGILGARMARMISDVSNYQDFEITLREVLAEIQDADMAEEISNLEANQTALEAQLRSKGTTSRRSLMDYLG